MQFVFYIFDSSYYNLLALIRAVLIVCVRACDDAREI